MIRVTVVWDEMGWEAESVSLNHVTQANSLVELSEYGVSIARTQTHTRAHSRSAFYLISAMDISIDG